MFSSFTFTSSCAGAVAVGVVSTTFGLVGKGGSTAALAVTSESISIASPAGAGSLLDLAKHITVCVETYTTAPLSICICAISSAVSTARVLPGDDGGP